MRPTSLELSLVSAVFLTFGACGASLADNHRQVPAFSKDTAPPSSRCASTDIGSSAWQACIGSVQLTAADDELFHAGYWLAKTGRYQEARAILERVRVKDERVLTYIGFATRKLGDVAAALPLYDAALAINPNYTVARAYLGEAYLTRGEPDRARAELAEIAARTGATSAPYLDLARHIADYERAEG